MQTRKAGGWQVMSGCAVAVVLSAIGCTAAATPSIDVASPSLRGATSGLPTSSAPTENHPAPGSVYVEKDPIAASRPLSIRLVADGEVLPHPNDFADGEAVRFQRSASVGPYRIQVDGRVCLGQFTVGLRQETDIALTEARASCSIRIVADHPDDEQHGFARLTGTVDNVSIGTLVTLRSLDDSPEPIPPAAETDEGGFFVFPLIPPGAYSVEVIVDGQLVAQRDVDLRPGDAEDVSLSSGSGPP